MPGGSGFEPQPPQGASRVSLTSLLTFKGPPPSSPTALFPLLPLRQRHDFIA